MKKIYAKAKKIKLLILDVDGVLTDGRLFYSEQGEVTLGFHIHDGLGIDLLHRAGIDTAIISGRKAGAVEKRAEQLKIRHVYLGCAQKAIVYKELREKLQLTDEQIAYVGDDWIDIPAMRQVGLKIAVANAMPEVKDIADWKTPKNGGKGAVRDVCELLLKAQDQYDGLLASYFQDVTL
jgi:3-deoxy-D-manno-octulosonate 8-phosphate phosphatase (KDO 8-P phosphatase)